MTSNLKIAVRSLRKSPFVTVVAIVSLALGIGANAAIFSMFHQYILAPLPVDDPATLVNLSAPGPKPGSSSCNEAGSCEVVFSYPMFRDLQGVQTAFTALAAHRSFPANLAYGDETAVASGMLVSGSYFPTLGLRAAVGRLINEGDDPSIGEAPVVVLSHAYWQERFAADPSIVGHSLVVNGQPLNVIGVAPEGFAGTTKGIVPRIFVPLTMLEVLNPRLEGSLADRRDYRVYVFGRLAPGVSIEGARAALNGRYSVILSDVEVPLQEGMSGSTMEQFRAKQILIEDGRRGQSALHADSVAPLTLLNSITFLVLLIACANIANLLLGRAVARTGEMAVRVSMGANRGHLVGQLLTESLLLAAAGGMGGLLTARWTLAGIRSLMPDQVAATLDPTLSPTVLLFTAATALGAGLVFGLFPALISTRSDLVSALKGQAGRSSGARSASRFRTTLATAQIALSMALLVFAGLFIRSLSAVNRVELGIETADLMTFTISPERNGYEPAMSRDLMVRTEESLATLPGVTDVSASMVPILAGSSWGTPVHVEGFENGPGVDSDSRYNVIAPDYFRTLGISLLAGREFTDADVSGQPRVAVVNQEFARKFGLGRDAVGRRMSTGADDSLDIEIVGLVQNSKYNNIRDQIPPLFYLAYRQEEVGFMTFYARTELDAREQLSALAPLVAALDPNLPVENPRTMQMQIEESTFGERMISVLSSSFAALATLLASVGLYGLLAYTVAQRRREIGLRLALGADAAKVRGLVLRQTAVMTVIGGGIGIVAAIALGTMAESVLFEVTAFDPTALAGAVVLLGVIAIGAGTIPAHRAARVDPMLALRAD